MNERLINLFQQNRAEKVRAKNGRGIKIPSGTVVNEEIPQEEQQPVPSWQCNNMVESSNDESSDEEEDDGTTCKIWKILWIELMKKCGDWVQCDMCDECICPKCYDKRDISADDDFFVVFASDHKY